MTSAWSMVEPSVTPVLQPLGFSVDEGFWHHAEGDDHALILFEEQPWDPKVGGVLFLDFARASSPTVDAVTEALRFDEFISDDVKRQLASIQQAAADQIPGMRDWPKADTYRDGLTYFAADQANQYGEILAASLPTAVQSFLDRTV